MKQLIEICNKYKLTTDELASMYGLKYTIFLDRLYPPVQHMEPLRIRGFVHMNTDGMYSVTLIGQEILNELEDIFKKPRVKPTPFELGAGQIKIKEYLDLWTKLSPPILPTGSASKVNQAILFGCFTWFFSNYSYTWETVLAATEIYLEQQADMNFKSCRTSQYFIVKQIGGIKESPLASFCEIYLKGGNNDKHQFDPHVK